MSITNAQNSKENIRLLVAQRRLYSVAKRFRAWQSVVIVGLAVISPFFVLLPFRGQIFVAIVWAVWLVVSIFVLGRFEEDKIRLAATIQEQFDVGLFGIPWNPVRVRSRVTPELIDEANHDFKGDVNEFTSWYGDVSKVAYPLDVLLCQRSNLVWDWRLRRWYAGAIGIATASYFVLGGLLLYFHFNQPARDILLAWFFPSLSVLIEGVKLSFRHLKVAQEKEALEAVVTERWQTGVRDIPSLTPEVLRQIQDRIYDLRVEAPPVPDLLNARFRDKFEANMHAAIKDLQAEAEAVSTNNARTSGV